MKNKAYIKVLGDLKVMMKKRMLEGNKPVKEDDEDSKKEKEKEKEKKKEKVIVLEDHDSDMEENYLSDFMKSKRRRNPKGSGAIMAPDKRLSKAKKISGKRKKA